MMRSLCDKLEEKMVKSDYDFRSEWLEPPDHVKQDNCACIVRINPNNLSCVAMDFECCGCSAFLASCHPSLTFAEVTTLKGPRMKPAYICAVCKKRIGVLCEIALGCLCDDCSQHLFKLEVSSRFAAMMLIRRLGVDITKIILSRLLALPFVGKLI